MVSSDLFHSNWSKINLKRCIQNWRVLFSGEIFTSLSYVIFLTNMSYVYHTIASKYMQLMSILQNCLVFTLYELMMCVHPMKHKRGEFLLI